uniref:Uncharacterized protein n=1 Tax=Micrurus spixii TaxID=129469 RepID=A0A2D4LGK2_9SAUR
MYSSTLAGALGHPNQRPRNKLSCLFLSKALQAQQSARLKRETQQDPRSVKKKPERRSLHLVRSGLQPARRLFLTYSDEGVEFRSARGVAEGRGPSAFRGQAPILFSSPPLWRERERQVGFSGSK